MDPTATLATIRQLILDIENTGGNASAGTFCQLADSLAENMKALDQWMAKGGFLPKQWQPPK
jgi:hypothetical protein